MYTEIFRAIAYKGTDGVIIAEGLELGQVASGDNVEKAFNNLELQLISLLCNLQGKYGTSMPSDKRMWELFVPGSTPTRIKTYRILDSYEAEIRFYDRTDVHIPIEERD